MMSRRAPMRVAWFRPKTSAPSSVGAYPEGSDHAFEMRTFAPDVGVDEDPVCGSMNASDGQWLAGSGAAPQKYRVSQGARLGRAGDITITTDSDETVWVGGNTTTCFRGTALIPN